MAEPVCGNEPVVQSCAERCASLSVCKLGSCASQVSMIFSLSPGPWTRRATGLGVVFTTAALVKQKPQERRVGKRICPMGDAVCVRARQKRRSALTPALIHGAGVGLLPFVNALKLPLGGGGAPSC